MHSGRSRPLPEAEGRHISREMRLRKGAMFSSCRLLRDGPEGSSLAMVCLIAPTTPRNGLSSPQTRTPAERGLGPARLGPVWRHRMVELLTFRGCVGTLSVRAHPRFALIMWPRQDHDRPHTGSRSDEMPVPSNTTIRMSSGGNHAPQRGWPMDSERLPDRLLSGRRRDKVPVLPDRAPVGFVLMPGGGTPPYAKSDGARGG